MARAMMWQSKVTAIHDRLGTVSRWLIQPAANAAASWGMIR
jgi:hypothetical protein